MPISTQYGLVFMQVNFVVIVDKEIVLLSSSLQFVPSSNRIQYASTFRFYERFSWYDLSGTVIVWAQNLNVGQIPHFFLSLRNFHLCHICNFIALLRIHLIGFSLNDLICA